MWKERKKYGIIFAGAVLYAFSVALILKPNQLAPGGASGLAIMISYFTGIKTGTIILILNIPLIISGVRSFGKEFLYGTMFAIFINSIFVNLFEGFPAPLHDMFLASVCGGTLDAVSLGIILRQGGTTGGTDIVAKILRKRMPQFEMGKLFILVDMVVVALSASVFGNIENAIYSAICVVITGQVMDRILYGGQGARMLFIMSDSAEKISRRLIDMDMGITYLKGRGGYTDREKNVIICVMRKRLLPAALKMIREEDEKVFMIVTLAEKVVGEGYRENE